MIRMCALAGLTHTLPSSPQHSMAHCGADHGTGNTVCSSSGAPPPLSEGIEVDRAAADAWELAAPTQLAEPRRLDEPRASANRAREQVATGLRPPGTASMTWAHPDISSHRRRA